MPQYQPGGLTFSATFVSEFHDTGTTIMGQPSNASVIITGEDGVRYYVAGGGSGATSGQNTTYIYDADTGLQAFAKSNLDIIADADAIGVTPFPSGVANGLGSHAAFVIPNTPYVCIIFGTAGGVSTDKRILYYRIDSGSNLVLDGGYACRTDGLTAQGSPARAPGKAIYAAGHIIASPTSGTNNAIEYSYPIGVAYYGNSRSTLYVVPSINYVLANTPIIQTGTNPWAGREISLSSPYGTNIFEVDGAASAADNRSRGFFVPVNDAEGGSFLCQMFYTADLEEHDAGTASPSNAYLTTYAPTYVDGLISATEVNLAFDGASPFDYASSLGSSTVDFHPKFRTEDLADAFPFPDDKENYDNTPGGTALTSFYCNPSVYPSDEEDPTEPWFLFFPHIYRGTGEKDKLGVRVFQWNPATQQAKLLDYAEGQVFTIGVDVDAQTDVRAATVTWDRVTGDITLLMRSIATGEDAWIVSEFGTFVPVPEDPPAVEGEELKIRAWTFTQDGHNFYVLRLGELTTFVYDLTTGQFAEWKTQGYNFWNANHGVPEWNGYPVAADIIEPFLWNIDPEQVLDEDVNPITRVVTAIIPHRERDPLRHNELRLTASVGAPYTGGAQVSIRWSDDQGQSYSTPLSIGLDMDNFSQVLRYRSLGLVQSPGRIIEITDVGGLVRIDGCDAEVSAKR